MEFIDTIMGKFAGKFDYEQLNLIRNIVMISLEDYDVKPKQTELATATAGEVNRKLLKMYVAELKVNGKSEKTIKQYVRNTTKLLEACNKVCVDITSNDVLLYFAKLQMSGILHNLLLLIFVNQPGLSFCGCLIMDIFKRIHIPNFI